MHTLIYASSSAKTKFNLLNISQSVNIEKIVSNIEKIDPYVVVHATIRLRI